MPEVVPDVTGDMHVGMHGLSSGLVEARLPVLQREWEGMVTLYLVDLSFSFYFWS